ncbi:putative secreted protein (IPTL-CTERM system target) [Comamonas sp. JUb58]|nr:putative secreted protein (IPTL-CTERM system target) [Comamonas sp. JUb58]
MLVKKTFGLSLLVALGLPTVNAQTYLTPGVYTYNVPPDTASLQITLKGGAGGAGGWDDAHGGDGAGGSVLEASIAVKGGETVDIVVGDGGQGALGNPNLGQGGTGGGLAAALPGAGGSGGTKGPAGSSPGGAGGGGASFIKIEGAIALAGGGGGGGSNSVIRGPSNTWNIPADSATNNLILNLQDPNCFTPTNGGMGESGPAGVDGSGGSGGGGGYLGFSGVGGAYGVDRTIDKNGQPGTSGASCTLDAGDYRITNASVISVGNPSSSNKTTKGTNEASGEAGSVTINAIPAVMHTITLRAEANGAIDPSVQQTVRAGTISIFTITPNADYTTDVVAGCGGSLTGNIFTTAEINADCIVTASFKNSAPPTPTVATPVPTLGTWALALLAGLLAFLGYRRRA